MTDWKALESQVFMRLFRRTPVVIVRGEGCRVWDEDGRSYLDMVAGWAVNALGHCPPRLVEAISRQAATLIQTSNQFYTIPQLELAKLLVDHSPFSRVFFSNSGAEANEGAVKIARKFGKRYRNGAYGVITCEHSFHGRTLAMVAATGKPAYQKDFTPLPPGFVNVPYDDIEAIKRATTDQTVAVMVEPLQGEGGVNVPSPDYLRQLRAWCDEQNLLLIVDEVQTGVGRLGDLWGHTASGIVPDVMTLAKGLGGGVPIGAILVTERAHVLEPGDHGSTFGGNPLACAAALAVMREVIERDLPRQAAETGAYFKGKLNDLRARFPGIKDVRGRGLLLAMEFEDERAAKILDAARERGLLLNMISPTTIRFMPPLIISRAEIDEATTILEAALAAVAEGVAA